MFYYYLNLGHFFKEPAQFLQTGDSRAGEKGNLQAKLNWK